MKRTPMLTIALVVSLSSLVVGALWAAEDRLNPTDRDFLLQGAKACLGEVKLNQLALDRALSPEVKKFAQQMFDEHTRMNQDLKALAEKKGVPWPTAIDPTQQAVLDQLTKLNGADFDRQFMSDQLKQHREAIAKLEAAVREAQDADVKALASKTLPKIREHLRMAQRIAGQNQ
jgi:putative membrane protein